MKYVYELKSFLMTICYFYRIVNAAWYDSGKLMSMVRMCWGLENKLILAISASGSTLRDNFAFILSFSFCLYTRCITFLQNHGK